MTIAQGGVFHQPGRRARKGCLGTAVRPRFGPEAPAAHRSHAGRPHKGFARVTQPSLPPVIRLAVRRGPQRPLGLQGDRGASSAAAQTVDPTRPMNRPRARLLRPVSRETGRTPAPNPEFTLHNVICPGLHSADLSPTCDAQPTARTQAPAPAQHRVTAFEGPPFRPRPIPLQRPAW